MIWPFSRDRRDRLESDDPDTTGADASKSAKPGTNPTPPAPPPLLGQEWDPMAALAPRDGAPASSSPDASEQPTYTRPKSTPSRPAQPTPAAQPVRSQPAPGWRGVVAERPGEGTAGGVVLPGGVLAGGLRPPGPSATPDDIEAFLHAVRAMHRIDSGHLAGVMPRARPAVSDVGSTAVGSGMSSTTRGGVGEGSPSGFGPGAERSGAPKGPAAGQGIAQAPSIGTLIAPRDVDAQGLPRESRSGRWYLPGTPIVMARGLVAAAGDRRLLPVDLTLSAGERWGVLGANGAGKTTLLRTLAGLHSPVSGMLEWSGIGSTKLNAQAWAKHCAFLPTVVPEPFDETVRSRVARIGSLGPRVDAALLAMGLAEFADRRWSTLSSGERQRAWVAFALASDADALLLDEPLAHQDPRERLRLADAFAAESGQGRLVVLTAHDPDWVLGHCTHAIVIAVDGSMAHGPVDRILQPQILAAAYAVPWRRVVVNGRHALVAGR